MLKIAIIKGNRDGRSKNHANKLEIIKLRKQLKMKLNGIYVIKVDSKAFAIPIPT